MPRGSKPGERRGGRQLGTPNKKTALRNAAIAAAAANPNLSPLDFLLNLMSDENTPAGLQLQIAQTAAPYFHDKLSTDDGPRKGKQGMAVAAFNGATELRRKSQSKANCETRGNAVAGSLAPSGRNGDLSPLEVMQQLMRDPQVPAHLSRLGRTCPGTVCPSEKKRGPPPDPKQRTYLVGFVVDPEVAAALRDDTLRRDAIVERRADPDRDGALSPDEVEELALLEARTTQVAQTIECPAEYGRFENKRDVDRLRSLTSQRDCPPPDNFLTHAEEVEEAQIIARNTAYRMTAEGRGQLRAEEPESKAKEVKWRKDLPDRLTPEEGVSLTS